MLRVGARPASPFHGDDTPAMASSRTSMGSQQPPSVLASHVDHVTDQGGELLQLGLDIGNQFIPILHWKVADPHQHLDVRAETGQRGS